MIFIVVHFSWVFFFFRFFFIFNMNFSIVAIEIFGSHRSIYTLHRHNGPIQPIREIYGLNLLSKILHLAPSSVNSQFVDLFFFFGFFIVSTCGTMRKSYFVVLSFCALFIFIFIFIFFFLRTSNCNSNELFCLLYWLLSKRLVAECQSSSHLILFTIFIVIILNCCNYR